MIPILQIAGLPPAIAEALAAFVTALLQVATFLLLAWLTARRMKQDAEQGVKRKERKRRKGTSTKNRRKGDVQTETEPSYDAIGLPVVRPTDTDGP